MLDKKQITAFIKKVSHGQVGIRTKTLMHPTRDWVVSVVVGIVIFLSVMVWSSVVYIKNNSIEVDQTLTNENDAGVYREATVVAALKNLSAQADALQSLLAIPTEVSPAATATMLTSELSPEPPLAEEVPEALPTELLEEVSNQATTTTPIPGF